MAFTLIKGDEIIGEVGLAMKQTRPCDRCFEDKPLMYEITKDGQLVKVLCNNCLGLNRKS